MSTHYFNIIRSISHQNKYTRWYLSICGRALTRPEPTCYYENHHILPKSCGLGGENDSDNLVKLTFREHFIVHWLLTKMMIDDAHRANMVYALTCFSMVSNALSKQRRVTSRMFEIAKSARKQPCSESRKLAISKSRKKTGRMCCIHCRKETDPANNKQFHGENCKFGPNAESVKKQRSIRGQKNFLVAKANGNYVPPKQLPGKFECPYCGKIGTNNGSMKRFHFDNCTSHPSGGRVRLALPNRKVSCCGCKQETDLANLSKNHKKCC